MLKAVERILGVMWRLDGLLGSDHLHGVGCGVFNEEDTVYGVADVITVVAFDGVVLAVRSELRHESCRWHFVLLSSKHFISPGKISISNLLISIFQFLLTSSTCF